MKPQTLPFVFLILGNHGLLSGMYLERFIETSISNLYIFKEVHLGYYFSLFDVGFVYNVSPYMEYHPGGEEELMRAAGSDGTDLFDQVRY